MKKAIDEIKSEIKSKLLVWKNQKNQKIKVALVFLFIAIIALKIFTTVLTFDWIAGLFN